MDLQAHRDLIFGEEFCLPTTATYYPTFYTPPGNSVPAKFYEHQTILGCNNQGLHYAGHQTGTSCMYYAVPNYGIAQSTHGPHPLHPCAIDNGRYVGAQEYRADIVEHTYHQQIHTSHYAVLPSAADRTPTSTAQPLAYTNGLFVPGRLGQTVAAASERGGTWSPSLQSASISSMNFRDHAVVPEGQLRRPARWKRQLARGAMVPAKLPRARQAIRRSLHVAVPSVKSSLQTNLSHNNHVSNVGSDLRKVPAERSQPSSKTSSYANRGFSFVSRQNIGEAKKPMGSTSSEIIVKSYTSKLLIGDPDGKIIIRPDQYNRDEFQVVYPNAKFFVIKSFDEGDIHKSIKYGVWSTSSVGNKKLDSAFREAQAIAASSSTLCPVFLFFSVNESSHFCGVAEMVGPVDFQKDMDFWCKDRWIGSFPVKWHIIKDVPNTILRSILLENNGYKPVTSSRDTQEIRYTPGTTMLKIFKYTRTKECLLDEFMMHEEEEARSSQRKMFKLRRGAPQFMPASMHSHRAYKTLLPKFDSVLMDRIIRETNDLTEDLQVLNLDRHLGSWQEFGNLTSKASTANAQKENYCHGKQAHENILKAMTYQAYQPLASNMKAALDGEHLYPKKVEIAPSGKTHSETAARVLSKAPEEHPNEDKKALVHTASGAPDPTCEEQKIIGKACSLAINSQLSEACPKSRSGVVAIGSMLVPVAISN